MSRTLSLLATALVSMALGCASVRPAAKPPQGMVFLKEAIVGLPSGYSPQGFFERGCNSGMHLAICDINGKGAPSVVAGSLLVEEATASGAKLTWNRGYHLTPGRQLITLVNDKSCKEGLRWSDAISGLWLGMLREAIEEDVVQLDFQAEPDRSYVLSCDGGRTPWVWVTPEEQW